MSRDALVGAVTFSAPIGDGGNPSPSGEEKFIDCRYMRLYKFEAYTKTDLKAHLMWIPKYRKRVLIGRVPIQTRDVLCHIGIEHEIEIISGKVSNDHIHTFISYRPTQNISKIME